MNASALDTRPLFTVYALVAGAVQGYTTRGGYADAVAFMARSLRHTPTAITQEQADTQHCGATGNYAPYAG